MTKTIDAALAAAAAFAVFAAVRSEAQVPEVSAVLSVTAKMDKAEFVRGEPVTLSGSVANSGETAFVVDDYGDWLRNTVKVYVFEGETGRMIMPRRGAPHSAVRELSVRPGSEKEFSVDLRESFDLPPHGRFQAAVVATRGGAGGAPDESAGSRRMAFSVVDGVELKSATRTRAGDERRPLRFSLVYWDQASRQNLFLRVSDAATGSIVAFYSLGAFLRVAEPSLVFGADDTAAVVQQVSRDRFARTVVSYAAGRESVVSRDDNLVSADAFSDAVSTRLVNERVDQVLQKRQEEKKGGFFRRHKTRTELPQPSPGSPAPQPAPDAK